MPAQPVRLISGPDFRTVTVYGDTTANISLNGIAGLATATLSASPTQLNFPPTNSNSQLSGNVIVTNIGIPQVTINNVSTDSAEFSFTSYVGSTLITGQTGSIAVTFRPTAAGSHTGNTK